MFTLAAGTQALEFALSYLQISILREQAFVYVYTP
jgi:hypothetical protein